LKKGNEEMSSNLIERYINEVIGRLPEKERDEVRKELIANIFDMLSEDATDEEVADVLNGLGNPKKLAEQYRQKPRYLISPAVYDDYIRALRWVLPLFATIFLVVAIITEVVGLIGRSGVDSGVEVAYLAFFSVFGSIVFSGVSGLVYGFVVITIIFVIIERTNFIFIHDGTSFSYKVPTGEDKVWTVSDLPELKPESKYKIPISDTIVEMVMVVFFGLIFIGFVSDSFPILAFRVFFDEGMSTWGSIFTPEFTAVAIPIAGIVIVISTMEYIFKIIKRSWTLPVCIVTVFSNILSIILLLFMVVGRDVLNPEFREFITSLGERDGWNIWLQSPQIAVGIFALIVVVEGLINSGVAIYKTTRNYFHLESGEV
jgi:hypothetical protein